MVELIIASVDGEVLRRFELAGRRSICIGRGTDCDVRIADPAVSRQHAELMHIQDNDWVLRDLNSTHGCLVEGERVREVPVQPGLEVRIGPAVLKFADLARRIGAELDELLEDDDGDTPTDIISGQSDATIG